MNVIPYPTPEDEDLLSRITKLATYVARNGTEFEDRVKDKERSNPLFEFLFNENFDGFFFYQWKLFCQNNQYTDDQVHCMEEAHAHRIEWRAPSDRLGDTTTE